MSIAINVHSAFYAMMLVTSMALPMKLLLAADTTNYEGPNFEFVLCFTSIHYYVRGRKVFVGPRREP